ncbi:MAG TPA: aldehyde dehydrogenase family protein [Vicinamibacterales bacterium]|nr:aldehyde dehydrogenase family protein [Vicinamibacterales bacterium]
MPDATAPERLRGADTTAAPRSTTARARLGEFGVLLGGRSTATGTTFDVRSPYDGELVATVHRAGPSEVEQAIARTTAAFAVTRRLPTWKRAQVLEGVSAAIAARRDELATAIALEAGKPIRTARAEVDRAVFTFKIAAEETKRIYGEIVELDWLPGLEGREAHVRRVPLGPVAGITPFNFPINLVAHKVAPALASGDPVIIRPATQTPVSALLLGRLVVEAGWPEDGIAVIPSTTADAAPLVEDERIKLLSFTGSPAVGWALKARAGHKRVTLELGGNAAVIVHADADVAYAAERVAWGGFSYAGQSCISAQRIYVHDAIYEAFRTDLMSRLNALKTGHPLDDTTDVGPVIDGVAADRIGEWLQEAVRAGAKILTGGVREHNVWRPTVVEDTPASVRLNCQEVFAPVVTLQRYSDVDDAIHAAGASDFGLQAGLFTHDDRIVARAVDEIEAGGIMVNDVSTFRVDHMPYGGVKLSGFGREGLRYAIEEMTELKLVTFNRNH